LIESKVISNLESNLAKINMTEVSCLCILDYFLYANYMDRWGRNVNINIEQLKSCSLEHKNTLWDLIQRRISMYSRQNTEYVLS